MQKYFCICELCHIATYFDDPNDVHDTIKYHPNTNGPKHKIVVYEQVDREMFYRA